MLALAKRKLFHGSSHTSAIDNLHQSLRYLLYYFGKLYPTEDGCFPVTNEGKIDRNGVDGKQVLPSASGGIIVHDIEKHEGARIFPGQSELGVFGQLCKLWTGFMRKVQYQAHAPTKESTFASSYYDQSQIGIITNS